MNYWIVGGSNSNSNSQGSRSQLLYAACHSRSAVQWLMWPCLFDVNNWFLTSLSNSLRKRATYVCSILVITADICEYLTCLGLGKWFGLRVPWASLIGCPWVGDLFNCSGTGIDLKGFLFISFGLFGSRNGYASYLRGLSTLSTLNSSV